MIKKTLLIAEKADVAKSNYLPLLERVSGEKFIAKSGYFESHSFYLTWFIGHLLQSLMPDEYDEKFKQWSIDNLPIIPYKLINKIKSDREKQVNTIISLAKNSSQLICGTDADREGQRIFTSFVDYFKLNLPTKRLWPSPSYADDDLDTSWKKMKDMKDWQGWTNAADMRNETDWLIGINATRAYSAIARTKLPIGRVQTATLALVVERDQQVENYKESFFYMIKCLWGGIKFTFYEGKEKRFENESFCKDKIRDIETQLFHLNSFQKEKKKENPPKPYSQPELQIDADKKFGFTAIKTLEICQKLYEKKFTTYPRTDSNNLPKSDYQKYRNLVLKYADPEESSFLLPTTEMPHFFIDKEEPHSALAITSQEPSELTDDEVRIYGLIRDRFIISFMKPAEYIQYDIEIGDKNGNTFKARIREDTFTGFKSYFQSEDCAGDEASEELQKIAVNEELIKGLNQKVTDLHVDKIKRSRPVYFTQGMLLSAMKNCGRMLNDDENRSIMFQKEHPGIGTPATQASTIKQIIDYEYVSMEKNKIISTPKGRKLIAEISPDLKTPALTANWELKLKKVQDMEMSIDVYRLELHEYVRKIVSEAKNREERMNFYSGEKSDYNCPSCKGVLFKKTWGFQCESKECGFAVQFKIAEKTIPESIIGTLLKIYSTPVIKGFRSSKGKIFDAKLVIRDEKNRKKVDFEFENIACPKCSIGTIRIFEWGAGCTEKDNCGFRFQRTIAGKNLTDTNIRKLLVNGKTSVIKGFRSREGKYFDAILSLDQEFKIRFDHSK